MEQKTQAATVTMRINHTRTQKAGWQHETTVTLSGSIAAPGLEANDKGLHIGPTPVIDGNGNAYLDLPSHLRGLLVEADTIGREESARRNALDQEGAA
jgi:hypothetical protein